MLGYHTLSRKTASAIASLVSAVLIALIVTPLTCWLLPVDGLAIAVAIINFLAIGLASLVWAGVVWRKDPVFSVHPPSAIEWVGIFLLASLISAVFIFFDCGFHFPQPNQELVCDGHPGIGIIFTVGAVALAAISLPSIVRAYLIDFLSSEQPQDHVIKG